MSSQNINREKSKRWVSNSTINYDGDDWSDEYDYSGEEDNGKPFKSQATPRLPNIDLNQFKQNSDIDEDQQEEEELHDENPITHENTTKREDVIEPTLNQSSTHHSKSRNDEITSSTSSTHQDKSQTTQPVSQEIKTLFPAQSKLSDGPSQRESTHEYDLLDSDDSSEEFKPRYTKSQRFKSSYVPSCSSSTQPKEGQTLSPIPTIATSPVVQAYSDREKTYRFNEPEFHSDDESEPTQHPLSPRVPQETGGLNENSLKIDRVVSQTNSIGELTDLVDEYNPYEGKEEPQQPEQEGHTSDTDIAHDTSDMSLDNSPVEPLHKSSIGSVEGETRIKQEPKEEEMPMAQEVISSFAEDVSSQSEVPEPRYNPSLMIDTLAANALKPPSEPIPSDMRSPGLASIVSEADTLHIQPSSDSSSSSIREITRKEFEGPKMYQDRDDDDQPLVEHAYLGSWISTPDLPNSGKFESLQTSPTGNQIKDTISQKAHEPLKEKSTNPETASKTVDQRDSRFYHSIDDYVEDFTDEQQEQPQLGPLGEEEIEEEEQWNEDKQNAFRTPLILQAPTFDNQDRHLSMTSVQSTGSVSTGTFSIRSESAVKTPKFNDRTASLTAQSIPEIPTPLKSTFTRDDSDMVAIEGELNDDQKDPMDYDDMMSLNTTMSINYGHWRPETDNFRDQFINGAAPPIPNVENYTRDVNGEIVQDVHSTTDNTIYESIGTSTGDTFTKPQGETYRTESNTSIPLHIPVGKSPRQSHDGGSGSSYFQEVNHTTTTIAPASSAQLKVRSKPTTYNVRQIIQGDQVPVAKKIELLRDARSQEVAYQSGLEEWITYALETVEVVPYKSKVTQHVKDAYAEASIVAKKNTHRNNVGSFLGKSSSRVLHESSTLGQSFAKGIFSRGRKIMKGLEN